MIIQKLALVFSLALALTSSLASAEDGLGKYRNTWYYLAMEAQEGPRTARVLDLDGATLALVTQAFYKELLIEGSGKIRDGRVVNFAGRVKGQTRFKFVDAPFGLGIKNCPLEPLHSLAVDPSRIPMGSLVRIEETVGLRFPDGTVHSGLWRAVDVGSAIQGDRIDLFMGPKSNGVFLESAGITHFKPLTVTLVERATPDHCTQK